MFRRMLSVTLAIMLTASVHASGDPSATGTTDARTTVVIDRTKVVSGSVSMSGNTIRCSGLETRYKNVLETFEKDGKVVTVTVKVPYTVAHKLSADLSLEQVAVYDRRGTRIDSSALPKLLESGISALIVPVHKVDAETLKAFRLDAELRKSLKDERLIVIVPASKGK